RPRTERSYTVSIVAQPYDQFLSQQLPERKAVLTPWLMEKDIAMIYGPRGCGKTHIAIEICTGIAAGVTSLGRWKAPRPCRVVHVDGEMPAPLLQQWVAEAIGRCSIKPDPENLKIIAADCLPDGLPDLVSRDSQHELEYLFADAEIISLDNQSTL